MQILGNAVVPLIFLKNWKKTIHQLMQFLLKHLKFQNKCASVHEYFAIETIRW